MRAIVVDAHARARARGARAFPFVRLWALTQRGRAAAPVVPAPPSAPPTANNALLPASAVKEQQDGSAAEEEERRLRGEAAAALQGLMEQPVVEVLARVLSFVTGDAYRILRAR